MEIRERVLTHGASLPTRAGSSKKKNNKKKKNANKNKAAEQPVSGSSDPQQGSDKETLEDEPETPTQPVRSYDAHLPYHAIARALTCITSTGNSGQCRRSRKRRSSPCLQ